MTSKKGPDLGPMGNTDPARRSFNLPSTLDNNDNNNPATSATNPKQSSKTCNTDPNDDKSQPTITATTPNYEVGEATNPSSNIASLSCQFAWLTASMVSPTNETNAAYNEKEKKYTMQEAKELQKEAAFTVEFLTKDKKATIAKLTEEIKAVHNEYLGKDSKVARAQKQAARDETQRITTERNAIVGELKGAVDLAGQYGDEADVKEAREQLKQFYREEGQARTLVDNAAQAKAVLTKHPDIVAAARAVLKQELGRLGEAVED